MKELVLYTSGSTDTPKVVTHDLRTIQSMLTRSTEELQLSRHDTVLNTFPSNVIAYYAITGLPAISVGAKLVTLQFNPYEFIRFFNKHQPTVISIIPKYWEILRKTKEFSNLDMSCVRYCVTGSQIVPQDLITDLKNLGVQTIGNWYGSTENPPPVFVGYNSVKFDFKSKLDYNIEFDSDGECIVNNMPTNDIFDLETKEFLKRKQSANRNTWKTNI